MRGLYLRPHQNPPKPNEHKLRRDAASAKGPLP